MAILTKAAQLFEVKDFDEKQGIVEIYVNAFDNEDSDGDISAKGSFTKTIKENKGRINHYKNHDISERYGYPVELIQDNHGLKVISQMLVHKQHVKDIFNDYVVMAQAGKGVEHSIGYEVIKRDEKEKKIIREYKLWEYSTLANWGANPNTPFVGAKNLNGTSDDICDMIHFTEQVLRKGSYSDEKFKEIDKYLSKLQKAFNQLQPSKGTAHDDPNHVVDQLKYIKQNLQL